MKFIIAIIQPHRLDTVRGALQSLDMTVNSNFTVSSLTFTGQDLQLTYSSSSGRQFTLAGTAALLYFTQPAAGAPAPSKRSSWAIGPMRGGWAAVFVRTF